MRIRKKICNKCKKDFLSDYKKSKSVLCPDCQRLPGPVIPADTLTYQKKGIGHRLADGFSIMGSSGDR